MSSPIAHAAVGYAVYSIFRRKLPPEPLFSIPSRIAWSFLAVFLCLLPDLDVIAAWTAGSFERFHNNLSHSLLVCIVASIIMTPILSLFTKITLKLGFWFILTCVFSHILIDLCTMGRGVMILWPWTTMRFHLPLTLFVGVPWSSSLNNPLYLLMFLNDSCFAIAVIAAIIAIRRHGEQRQKESANNQS